MTKKGCEQARRQGEILSSVGLATRDVDAYCSPQGRARQTAGLALGNVGLVPNFDDRLCEIAFGDWQGLRMVEIQAQRPDLFFEGSDPLSWHFHAPGGESFTAICARCREFLASLSGAAVVVTHGITSRIMRGLWLDLDMNGMMQISGGQGCVYHLKDGIQIRLTAQNADSQHLPN